jgi:hypothetical protein
VVERSLLRGEGGEAPGCATHCLGLLRKVRSPSVGADFVVDDDPGMANRFGGYTVSEFVGDPEDRELLSLPGAVEALDLEGFAWPN